MKFTALLLSFMTTLSVATIEKVIPGRSRICAISDSGKLKCWGENALGQLGLGDTKSRGLISGDMGELLPSVDLGKDAIVTSVGTGAFHSCALLSTGQVKCWGRNRFGVLGLGDNISRGADPKDMGDNLPAVDLGKDQKATAIAVGFESSCALLESGRIKCWGRNYTGQLGLGHTVDIGDEKGEMGDALPAVDLGTNSAAKAIAMGEKYVCALLRSGKIKCWGYNYDGQLGIGDTEPRGLAKEEIGDNLPTVNLGTGVTAVSITASGEHTCALMDSGKIKCWGRNDFGQLGIGEGDDRGDTLENMGDALPYVNLGDGEETLSISAGGWHTCALLKSNKVKCWGFDDVGQLGLESTKAVGLYPEQMGNALQTVKLDIPAKKLFSGYSENCAVLLNGGLKCWGYNGYGHLGQGHGDNIGDMPGELGIALEYTDLGADF